MRPGRPDTPLVFFSIASGILALACIPGPASVTGTVSDTDASTDAPTSSAASTTSADASADASSSPEDSSSGSSGSVPVDPCLLSPPEACPIDDCMVIEAYTDAVPELCSIFSPVRSQPLCVSAGAPMPPDTRTTVYTEIDGQQFYTFTGHTCQFEGLERYPALWSECTLDPAEPQLCQCMCGADGCPHEVDRMFLDGCGLPETCGTVDPHWINEDEYSEYDQCLLLALRDRTAGAYASLISLGFGTSESRLYLSGTDQVQFVHREQDDLCFTPLEDIWGSTMTCTLQPPAWFDDCLMVGMDVGDRLACLEGLNWVQDCVEAPARCP